jgi:hypothetical protein
VRHMGVHQQVHQAGQYTLLLYLLLHRGGVLVSD